MFAGRGRFVRPWRRRRTGRDDTGSMPLALLVTLVSVTLSAGLSGVVVNQLRDTKREADRVAAINAAQAGLDAALAKIRTSYDATGGLLSKLPCSTLPQGALSDSAGGTAPTYSTSVGYFLIDPSSSVEVLRPIGDLTSLHSLVAKHLATPLTTGKLTLPGGVTIDATDAFISAVNGAVGCVGGVLKQVPLYGLLRSVGTVNGTTRTLYATYKFRNLNETIPGGKLVINPSSATKPLCVGASNGLINGDAPSAQQRKVKAMDCASDKKQVTFIYPKNLSLELSYSPSAKHPYGLCITAPTVPAAGTAVNFEPCSATSSYLQQWDYDVNRQTYYGAVMKDVGGKLIPQRSSFCLGMATYNPSPGGDIVLKTGGDCGTAEAAGRTMKPDNTVGAGGAGIDSEQYVNKDEVGRCLDLTNEDPSGNWAKTQKTPLALISYPCKQSLNGLPYWNHVWIGPLTPEMIRNNVTQATGLIYTTQPTSPPKKWCLNSPGIDGGWVWVAACNASDPNQRWTVHGATTLITQAYQVVDRYGHCLEAAGWRGDAYKYKKLWSFVTAETCTGSPMQKWNAPTDPELSPLRGIQER